MPETSAGAPPAIASAATPGHAVETWIDVCLADIHAALEAILPQMAGSRLEARGSLERLLGYTPEPELLDILKQVAEAPERSALRMGLGRMLIALAILVRREQRSLTEPDRLDAEMLRRQAASLPALVRRVEALDYDIQEMRAAAAAAEADRLRRLRVSLMPPLPRLQGLAALAPRLLRVAEAAVEGSLADADGVSAAEIAWFEVATDRASPRDPLVPRVLLDAVALRAGLARDLDGYWRAGSEDDRLRGDVAATDLVVERLQHEEARAHSEGHAGLARRLSAARRDLSELQRRLAVILRGGGSLARRRGAHGRARASRSTALLLAALVLTIAGALVLAPRQQASAPGGAAAPAAPGAGDAAFSRMERAGDVLVAEIPTLTWRRMSPEERQARVYSLGVMAFGQGVREVRVIDPDRQPLARWSRDGGLEILFPR